MYLGMDAHALMGRVRQGTHSRYLKFLPYLIGFIVLCAFLFASRPFWLTNDDVSMAMIANGTGIAAAPSPRLVLTNIAWGYLIGWLPGMGGIQPYTLMTYLALGLSYLAVLYALARSRANPWLAAPLILIVFVPTLIYPQYTLVAGYMACAGCVLICLPPAAQSRSSIAFAGVLLVLSGLVRADETLLVALVAAPLCLGCWTATAHAGIWRRWLLMLAIAGVAFAGLQLWDFHVFSAGSWQRFGETYTLRTALTDFNVQGYYMEHQRPLRQAGYSSNDLRLFSDWFYVDPTVFSVDNLSRLMSDIPISGRLAANASLAATVLVPFTDPQALALCLAILFIALYHGRQRHYLAGILILLGVMLLLLLLGRPGVTRIYVPALAVLALAGLMQPATDEVHRHVFPVLAVLVCAVGLLMAVHNQNQSDVQRSQAVHAATQHMPHEPLLVIWGADYPYTAEYLPFDPPQASPSFRIYSLGEYSLAPYCLESLYQDTRGKGLVQALLAGQSFDFIATKPELTHLSWYFKQHYGTELAFAPRYTQPYFTVYRVEKQELPGRLPAPL